ncbi:pseudaminic acid synthase [Sporocytophaga myxococcoides]|uniref:Pseudaminic acid synthase n=1 Tax=Sporocytophaga myxococcoides TaxID=153721 RepID=A0A098LA40_9BACT|nr:pseudaminic acid synthase [Sporocytophaga myxococcoides]GAL83269.1 pseudaminic acid synthase [Sporocytophaga myxococcoides]
MEIKIANKEIGDSSPVFIIAELSANHGQQLNVALDTVKAARDTGADAIKLQHYLPDTITLNCDNQYFQIKQGTIWDGTTLHKLYQEAYMPWEWTEAIMKTAEECGLICFSSPFDSTAVDLLETFDVPAYKIASFEINDIPLIKLVASKGKPVIISTGIATLADIELAVKTCRDAGNNQIALLKCTSAYPALPEEMNLRTIPNLKETFNVVTGLSDHTLGIGVPVASVALGAKIIEKHFILDKSLGGPDASFSLNPVQFTEMVNAVREVEKALGTVNYDLSAKSIKNKEFSRSLFIVKDVKEGELVSKENVKSIRPGFGMHTKHYETVLGMRFRKDLSKGTPLSFDQLS